MYSGHATGDDSSFSIVTGRQVVGHVNVKFKLEQLSGKSTWPGDFLGLGLVTISVMTDLKRRKNYIRKMYTLQ